MTLEGTVKSRQMNPEKEPTISSEQHIKQQFYRHFLQCEAYPDLTIWHLDTNKTQHGLDLVTLFHWSCEIIS